ncbi:hypothetical protein PQX77_016696 [Marasmius sp. AFHP31]|nr:hypothetical protein PQX77_016696 [Marasmius sp. AFHP31]
MPLALDNLSAELLTEIFRPIHDSSRLTIFSLLRVNKFISDAARPFVYRELTFDFDQHRASVSQLRQNPDPPQTPTDSYTRTLERLDSLLKSPPDHAIWKGVRKVTVHSWVVKWPGEDPDAAWRRHRHTNEPPFTPSEEAVQAKWGSFLEFLTRVINLQEVIFDCAERVPVILLKVLENKHASCYLQEIAYTSRAAGGCVVRGVNLEDLVEQEKERERFRVASPVKKTTVRKIKWDSIDLHLLHRWESFVDLRKVEILDLGRPYNTQWMDYAMDDAIFSGLKGLSLRINRYSRNNSQGDFKTTLENFLSSQPPLQSISVIDYHGYVDLSTILLHHGASLRSLSLHQAEGSEGPRPILTQDDLNLIRSKTPYLRHLEFDLNRTRIPKDNEMQVYAIISSFASLRTVKIHYDLGVHHRYFEFTRFFLVGRGSEREVPPELTEFEEIYTRIDENFAREVWQAVCNPRLEELVLYVGEQNREIGFGYPAHWVLEEQNARKCISVCRNERDDSRDDLVVRKIVKGPRA